jgi:hypothetical protein
VVVVVVVGGGGTVDVLDGAIGAAVAADGVAGGCEVSVASPSAHALSARSTTLRPILTFT